MAKEINFISSIFENYGGSLLLLGGIIAAIIIIKYVQSLSKKFSEIK